MKTPQPPTFFHKLLLCIIYLLCCSTDNGFTQSLDIGSVRSCVPLTSNVCPELTHLVPEPVAFKTNITDAFIQAFIKEYDQSGEGCSEAVRVSLCNEYYPICDPQTNTVSTNVPINCTDNINNACTSSPVIREFLVETVCNNFLVLNATSLDQCKSVQQWSTEYDYTLKRCGDTSTINDSMTEWMFRYLVKIDDELNTTIACHQPANAQCTSDFLSFGCASVGRCWNNGNRIELTHNQTDCLKARNSVCHVSKIINRIIPRQEVCNEWPKELIQQSITTPTTSITVTPSRVSDSTTSIIDRSTSLRNSATNTITIMETITTTPFPTRIPTNTSLSSSSTLKVSSFLIIFMVVLVGVWMYL